MRRRPARTSSANTPQAFSVAMRAGFGQIGFEGEQALLQVIQQCEEGMFTTAVMDTDREELISRVQYLLEELRENHSAYL